MRTLVTTRRPIPTPNNKEILMYKQVAFLMVGVGLVACGGEAPQSSSNDVQLTAVRQSPVSASERGSAAAAALPSTTDIGRGSPSTPDLRRGWAVLSSTTTALSLGAIPLQTRGANGATTGALASVAATVTNTCSMWTADGLTVSMTGSPEIVKGNASCAGQALSPQGGACQDSYMLDCTGAATQGAKDAVVTVTDPLGGSSVTFTVSGTCDPAATGVALIGFTPSSLGFGSVVQDTSSVVQKLTLTNTGAGATDLLPTPVVTGSPEFTVDILKCTNASLAMNGICGVNVYLNCGATTPGTKSGSVTYTAPNGGAVATATFTGECVAAGAGAGCSFNTDCASAVCDSTTHTCN